MRSAPKPETVVGSRRYRATVRTRLALTYSALLTGAGVVMLTIIYVFMRFVPTYDLVSTPSTPLVDSTPPGLPPSPVPTPSATVGTDVAATTTPAAELVISSTDQLLNLLLVVSLVVLVVLAIVGVGVGWVVAGRMLQPLKYINTAVHRATHGDLQHRIGLTGPRDEISGLATNFDEMLVQLERAFTASRRFAANASHELRTPLATTRAMLDVALAQHDDPETRQVLERLRVMNERNIETVEALLGLASIESSASSTETIDLARATAEAVESTATEAAQRGVRIELSLAPAELAGEAVLVRQLLTNLVSNAIRHNLDADGFVSVATRSDGDLAFVEVSNSGAFLDADTVSALTEPFSRTGARISSASANGHGLGLSIVSAITERLHGTLVLEPRSGGGLRATVSVPAAPSTNAAHIPGTGSTS
mgnify:CR=1 FL=1